MNTDFKWVQFACLYRIGKKPPRSRGGRFIFDLALKSISKYQKPPHLCAGSVTFRPMGMPDDR